MGIKMRLLILFYVLLAWIVIVSVFWYFGILSTSHSRKPTEQTSFKVAKQLKSTSAPSNIRSDYKALLDLCNLPQTIKPGNEGNISSDYVLRGVITVFRHGDRGPLTSVAGLENLNCSSFLSQDYHGFERSLKLKSKTLRQKLTQPFSTFPNIPDGDNCKPGFLSKQGSSQLIVLGKNLRKSYEKHITITNSTKCCENIRAISTPYARTFLSLRSFLYGFLGPELFTEVFVSNGLNVLFCQKNCKCSRTSFFEKKFQEELQQKLSSSSYLTKVLTQLSDELQIPHKGGSHIHSSTVRDHLLASLCHGKLPLLSNRSSLAKDFAYYLSHEASISSKSLNLKKASLLKAFDLVQTVQKQIGGWISAIRDSGEPKFVFFSGHDLTLLYLLNSFNIYDGLMPAYASRLVIELLADSSQRHYIRVVWNGEDVSSQICRGEVAFCPWPTFKRLLNEQMRTVFKTTSRARACEN